MKRILFYAELFPFRESFTQHSTIAHKYIAMVRHLRAAGVEAFVLANNETADRLVEEDPDAGLCILRLNATDEASIQPDLLPWREDAIAQWVSLATVPCDLTTKYLNILQKAYKTFPFSLIVCWGDNEAVNLIAKKTGADVLHLESGPTRSPLQETIYFDDQGTNSRAHFRTYDALELAGCPRREFWLASWVAMQVSEDVPSFYDMTLMLTNVPASEHIPDVGEPICYIPLQLADDLNMQVGSHFSSPEQFLQMALPQAVEAGYRVVIKPHPMAHTRAYNLHQEQKALRYARTFPQGITILDSSSPKNVGNWLLSNSDVVLTINSSVGFEAAMFGTPVLLAGDAAFDFCIFPRLDVDNLGEQISNYRKDLAEFAVRKMLGEILYPTSIFPSPLLASALVETLNSRGKDKVFSERLRQNLGPPSSFIIEKDLAKRPYNNGILPGRLNALVNRQVKFYGDFVYLGNLQLKIDGKAFDIGLEKVKTSAKGYEVAGWAFECGKRIPPFAVLLIDNGKVTAARVPSERRRHLEIKGLATTLSAFTIESEAALSPDAFFMVIGRGKTCRLVPAIEGRYTPEASRPAASSRRR